MRRRAALASALLLSTVAGSVEAQVETSSTATVSVGLIDRLLTPPGAAPSEVELRGLGAATSDDAFGAEKKLGWSFRLLLHTLNRATFPALDAATATERALDRSNALRNDGWSLDRALLRIGVRPTAALSARLQVDFAELIRSRERRTVKLAFADLELVKKRLWVVAGLVKRPFSLLELRPLTEFEFADAGPIDDLIKELGYGGRDVGLLLRARPLPKKKLLQLSAAVMAGEAAGEFRTPVGLVVVRAESELTRDLVVAIDGALRPVATRALYGGDDVPVDFLDSGAAMSADLTFTPGDLAVRAEILYGKRTDLLSMGRGDAGLAGDCKAGGCHFVAGWVMTSYALSLTPRWRLLPALRFEALDVTTGQAGGGQLGFTAAVNLDFGPEIRALVDFTQRWVEPGTQALSQLNEVILTPIREQGGSTLSLRLQVVL